MYDYESVVEQWFLDLKLTVGFGNKERLIKWDCVYVVVVVFLLVERMKTWEVCFFAQIDERQNLQMRHSLSLCLREPGL